MNRWIREILRIPGAGRGPDPFWRNVMLVVFADTEEVEIYVDNGFGHPPATLTMPQVSELIEQLQAAVERSTQPGEYAP